MKRWVVAAILLAACGGETNMTPREPVSVRGWIYDVERNVAEGSFKTVETEVARRAEMFAQTSVWIDNVAYVSGGVAEDGSFILLDVPPGNVTISFSAPGAETARLPLQNIPGNSDVLVPGLILKKDGSAVTDPKALRVRLPSGVSASKPTNATAIIAGHTVPIIETPYNQMVDRRDYPAPPGSARAIATVK